MPEVHAKLSASGSHRWLTCPRSVALEAKFPNESSVYAQEGTAAHDLCEHTAAYFLGQLDEPAYENWLDGFKKNQFYNEEMHEHAVSYAKFVKAAVDEIKQTCEDPFVALETRLDFSEYVPDGFGTGDCVIVADDLLQIIDFKYGRGVRVEAEDNSQMMLYAIGAVEAFGALYDVKRVRMTIYQPRVLAGVNSAEVTVDELLAWGETTVKPTAKLALNGGGEFHPSDEACRFCRARHQCRARAEAMAKLFDDAVDPDLLTDEEIGGLLKRAKSLEPWIKDLEAHASKTLLTGGNVPGWKLVEGRSVRKITDLKKAVEAFVGAGYDEALLYAPREVISLSQMEKDFGKKAVAEVLGDLVVKPKGSPALAPESDRRKAWTSEEAVLAAFDEGAD